MQGQYKTWTLDSGLDRGLDSKMDSVFRLEFQSPGVKGHVHINQQHTLSVLHIREHGSVLYLGMATEILNLP